MGGDEKRPSGTAVCDDATGGAEGGATTSGGVAPPSAAEPADPEVGEDTTSADLLDPVGAGQESEALDVAVEADPTSDEPAAHEPERGEPVSDASVPAEPEADDLDRDDPAPAGRPRRPRPYPRRRAVALAAAAFVALGVGAFSWAMPSPEVADRQFVEAAQSQGHVVAAGDQQALVVSAARKICDRRLSHDTVEDRRATALSAGEIAAVGAAFGAGTREFTALALKTYCSS